jgi:type IV pilus biogenesis protein CpaD/CtpE
MQLTPIIAAALALLALTGPAAAQSLSPMRNDGETPSTVKGFKLYIGNPYRTRMVFQVIPMDPKFEVAAADAAVNFPEIAMAPGTTRQVIVTFRIDPQLKERTIGVCVQPKAIEGTVMPRVCGTYTGRLSRTGG